jgi:putative aldouronate transport system permease protein
MHCSDRKEDKIMVGKQERRYQRMITVVLALISLIMVIPLVLLVVASFTSNNEIVLHGYSFFPKELSLEAYRYIWNERAQVFHAYGITILVTAIGTTIGVMMTLLYAYVLAHEKFPGKTFLAFYLFFTMLFNGGLVPTYIMYTRYLHMKNTIPALIIPGLLMSAFNVILTRTYIQSNVPAALSEAAKIDGATAFQRFRYVTFPYLLPTVTVNLILTIKQGFTSFDFPYALTGGGPVRATEVIGILIYNDAFKNMRFSMANAEACILFVIVAIFSLTQLKLTSKGGTD